MEKSPKCPHEGVPRHACLTAEHQCISCGVVSAHISTCPIATRPQPCPYEDGPHECATGEHVCPKCRAVNGHISGCPDVRAGMTPDEVATLDAAVREAQRGRP